MSQTCKYPLNTVMPLIEACEFSNYNKSVEIVILVAKLQGVELSAVNSEKWIRDQLLGLKDEDFYHRTVLWGDVKYIADVYGKIINSETWYIKFWIEDGCLDSISFHPAESDVVLQSGVVLEKGSWVYDEVKKVWSLRKPEC
jgi:hypothetical protein